MYNVIASSTTPESKKYLHSLTDRIPNNKLHTYRKWWAERGITMVTIANLIFQEKASELPDFYNLTPQKFFALGVLSSFMSQPIAQAIYDFIQRADGNQDPSQSLLPGDLQFKVTKEVKIFKKKKGKTRPLSVQFLVNLTIRCRQRVLEHIENNLFKGMGEIKSPALVDTYARLLYICPGTYGFQVMLPLICKAGASISCRIICVTQIL
jgi:hypothetical protein